jgi:hypothetical protein
VAREANLPDAKYKTEPPIPGNHSPAKASNQPARATFQRAIRRARSRSEARWPKGLRPIPRGPGTAARDMNNSQPPANLSTDLLARVRLFAARAQPLPANALRNSHQNSRKLARENHETHHGNFTFRARKLLLNRLAITFEFRPRPVRAVAPATNGWGRNNRAKRRSDPPTESTEITPTSHYHELAHSEPTSPRSAHRPGTRVKAHAPQP